jgi:UDPglucose 6-dehydrogenase
MKFGILGYGYVGKATHRGLLNDAKVIVHDITFDTKREILKDADTVFVCIPTATQTDIDTVITEIQLIQEFNPSATFIIRSTLPLGACTRIQAEVGPIIYIPEFLRERYWETDCLKRPLIVGYDVADFLPEWLQDEEIKTCSTTEAELIKMYSNNFAVMRIAFANVFYDLSENVGADYNKVLDMYLDVQQDQTYMEVPGHDGTRGFGGKCLPKDLDFLIETLDQHNIDQNWFKHIRELNNGWKEKF